MSGKFVIAVVRNKNEWVETTMRPFGTKPVLKRRQTVEIYCWRGLKSRVVKRRRESRPKKSRGGGAA